MQLFVIFCCASERQYYISSFHTLSLFWVAISNSRSNVDRALFLALPGGMYEAINDSEMYEIIQKDNNFLVIKNEDCWFF